MDNLLPCEAALKLMISSEGGPAEGGLMLKMEMEVNFGLSVVCGFLSGKKHTSGKGELSLSSVLKLWTCNPQGQAQGEYRCF